MNHPTAFSLRRARCRAFAPSLFCAASLSLLLLFCLALPARGALAAGERTVSTDAEFSDALSDSACTSIVLAADIAYAGDIGKPVSVPAGTSLSLSGQCALTASVSGGGTLHIADILYRAGGASITCAVNGAVFVPVTQSLGVTLSDGDTLLLSGGRVDLTALNFYASGLWLPSSVGGNITGAVVGGHAYAWSNAAVPTLCRQYSYQCVVYGTSTVLVSGVYTTGDKPVALPQSPTYQTMRFTGWTSVNDPNLTTLKATYAIPTGAVPTSGDTLLYYANFVNGAGGSGSGSTGAGTAGASGSGGMGGGGVAAAVVAAEATDASTAADGAAATGTAAVAGTAGARGRVSVASSSTKTSIDNGSTASAGLPTLDALPADTAKAAFPWPIVGAAALLALGMAGLLAVLKRRSDARTAAMLEKLHIHD